MTGEKQLHEQVIAYLKRHGYAWFRSRMDKATSMACGDPDFIIVKGDKVAFVEMKMPKGKVSAVQHQRFDELHRAGCTVKIARDAADAIRYIETVMGGNADLGHPETPESHPEPASHIWITNSKALGDVVVARSQTGVLGAIRLATAADKANLSRLPPGIA